MNSFHLEYLLPQFLFPKTVIKKNDIYHNQSKCLAFRLCLEVTFLSISILGNKQAIKQLNLESFRGTDVNYWIFSSILTILWFVFRILIVLFTSISN